jgi:hypothetical protein
MNSNRSISESYIYGPRRWRRRRGDPRHLGRSTSTETILLCAIVYVLCPMLYVLLFVCNANGNQISNGALGLRLLSPYGTSATLRIRAHTSRSVLSPISRAHALSRLSQRVSRSALKALRLPCLSGARVSRSRVASHSQHASSQASSTAPLVTFTHRIAARLTARRRPWRPPFPFETQEAHTRHTHRCTYTIGNSQQQASPLPLKQTSLNPGCPVRPSARRETQCKAKCDVAASARPRLS